MGGQVAGAGVADLVSVSDVQAAAARVAGHVVRTPLVPASWAPGDAPLWLKPENLQPTGAFKLRGAVNAVAQLPAGTRGVVTHSSGNHGTALARAARDAGLRVVVVVPEGAPAVKIAAIRSYRAEVVLVPPAERLAAAERLRDEAGLALVPPFDDPAIIAGQGTVGLEITADLPAVRTVVVPASGAGLLSGVAVAVRATAPGCHVVGVEPELAADLAEGWRLGRRVEWPSERTGRTIADCLRNTSASDLTWAHVTALVDDIVTVSDDALREAMRVLALGSRLVSEPGGAAAVAAYLSGAVPPSRDDTVAIVSGGNVDPNLLIEVLTEGNHMDTERRRRLDRS